MKYKVGDKVRIRKDLVPNTKYGKTYFVTGMKDYLGKVATIITILDGGLFYIDITRSAWEWTSSMFEPITKTLDNLEVGDILVNVLGEECKILGICGEVYFVSKTNEFDVYSGGYAREEIKNRTSWVLKDSEELEPKVKKAIKLLEEKGYKVEK